MLRYLFLLLLLCSPVGGAFAQSTGIQHVVLCWLYQPGDRAEIDSVLRTANEFREMTMLKNIVAGTALESEREIVDDSFDVGMIMQFRNQEELAAYLEHPFHLQKVKEVLLPKCRRVLVYDITY